MTTIVSVTPLPVERDSRTYKQAASLSRLGHDSIVLESGASRLGADTLPFELAVVPGSAVPTGRWAVARPDSSGPGSLRRALRRLLEPIAAVAASGRWNLRTYRALPAADLYILHSYNQYPAVRLRARRLGVPYIYDAHDSYWEEDPGEGGPDVFGSRLTRAIFERLERSCARHAAAGHDRQRRGRRAARASFRPPPRGDPQRVRPASGHPEHSATFGPPPASGPTSSCWWPRATPSPATRSGRPSLRSGCCPSACTWRWSAPGTSPFAALAAERGWVTESTCWRPSPRPRSRASSARPTPPPILYRAWTVNFQHALPNRFFHAVAAGLPVLYPPLAEIAALCSEHELGLPIDPLDPVSVADAARRLSEDPELLARLRANVERAAPLLSWEREEAGARRAWSGRCG